MTKRHPPQSQPGATDDDRAWCEPLGMSFDAVAMHYARRARHEIGSVAWLHQLSMNQPTPPTGVPPAHRPQDLVESVLELSQAALILSQARNPATWSQSEPIRIIPWLRQVTTQGARGCRFPDQNAEDWLLQANQALLAEALLAVLRYTTGQGDPSALIVVDLASEDEKHGAVKLTVVTAACADHSTTASAVSLLKRLSMSSSAGPSRPSAPAVEGSAPALPLLAIALAYYVLQRSGWQLNLSADPPSDRVMVNVSSPVFRP